MILQKQKNKLPVFQKEFARECPLFFCDIWFKAEQRDLIKPLGQNIKNELFIKEPSSDMVFICYDRKESDYLDNVIAKKVLQDKNFWLRVKNGFEKYWQLLEPYAKGKKIQSLPELKRYYDAWLDWWPFMALVFWIPSTESIKIVGPEAREAIKLRKQTEKFSEAGVAIFLDFFIKAYPQYAKLVRDLTPAEVFSLIKKPFNKKQITLFEQRHQKGFVLLNGKLLPYNQLKKFSFTQVKVQNNTIAGQIAYKGKKRGKVRVIAVSKDIYKMKSGEILVAPMTTPIYLLAIKKAVAFVTDEGGITCHAAIAAREFKKPCIIGTKIATQVLHDGDLVEVDADKGVVKIIKKNK